MNYSEHMVRSRLQLGWNIRQQRKDQRLSQAQLGLMVGRDRSYISRIERGRCNVTLETIVVLANGLGISPSQLLAGIGDATPPPEAAIPFIFGIPKRPEGQGHGE